MRPQSTTLSDERFLQLLEESERRITNHLKSLHDAAKKGKSSKVEEKHFQTRCLVQGNVCALVINGRSTSNMASTRLVSKLNLETKPHPIPYKFKLPGHEDEIHVDKQVQVSFSIRKYNENALCDVVPMETSHILLGMPWEYAKTARHDKKTNEYSFLYRGRTIRLLPLSPSEVCEDQKNLREKIETEKREKEREAMTQLEEREKEKDMLRAKELEKKIEIENQERKRELEENNLRENKESVKLCPTSDTHFFSSCDFNMQENEEVMLKTKLFKLPILRGKKQRVDIVPSAPLFVQPRWSQLPEAEVDNPMRETFLVNQATRDEDEYKQAVFDPGDAKWINVSDEMFLFSDAKAKYEKIVFDPGGIVLL